MKFCQVCSAPIADNQKNCNQHLHTRSSSVLLARFIHLMDERVSSAEVKELADKFGVSPTTVYNHMKREGFTAKREWRKKK